MILHMECIFQRKIDEKDLAAVEEDVEAVEQWLAET